MATTYLTRTPGSAGNRNKWTLSGWVKRSQTSAEEVMFSAYQSNDYYTFLRFEADGTIKFRDNYTGSANLNLDTNAVYRDTSAWYHVVAVYDKDNATSADKAILYINGERVTSFSTATYPSQSSTWNVDNIAAQIGSLNTGQYWNGSMAMVQFVDGQAYDATYFGSTDSTTGIWTSQASSTISSYGTNGFKLAMDTTTPGADTSGNTNNFTVGGGTPTLTQGSPSNNWCTWNSLVPLTTNYVYSNGNNTVNQTSGAWVKTVSTIGVNSGKWYWEVSATNAQISAGKYTVIGVATTTDATAASGMSPNGIGMKNNGSVGISTVLVATLSGFELGDIISCYLDMDNGALYYAKNGVMENSGVPTSGASKTGAFALPNPTQTHFATLSPYGTNNKAEANFGEGFFGTTAAGTQADDNGQGLFAYDVPAGYYALNTKNLEAYG
jgi:hypothetical protein